MDCHRATHNEAGRPAGAPGCSLVGLRAAVPVSALRPFHDRGLPGTLCCRESLWFMGEAKRHLACLYQQVRKAGEEHGLRGQHPADLWPNAAAGADSALVCSAGSSYAHSFCGRNVRPKDPQEGSSRLDAQRQIRNEGTAEMERLSTLRWISVGRRKRKGKGLSRSLSSTAVQKVARENTLSQNLQSG